MISSSTALKETIDEPIVLPFDVEFLDDLFEKYSYSAEDAGTPPTIELKGQEIKIGPICIVGFEPIEVNGVLRGISRRYLFVRPRKDLIEHLRLVLRMPKKSSVFFQIKVKHGRALVAARQGPDPGQPHLLAFVRADSIPEPEA